MRLPALFVGTSVCRKTFGAKRLSQYVWRKTFVAKCLPQNVCRKKIATRIFVENILITLESQYPTILHLIAGRLNLNQ
jgi:hypothetical protein